MPDCWTSCFLSCESLMKFSGIFSTSNWNFFQYFPMIYRSILWFLPRPINCYYPFSCNRSINSWFFIPTHYRWIRDFFSVIGWEILLFFFLSGKQISWFLLAVGCGNSWFFPSWLNWEFCDILWDRLSNLLAFFHDQLTNFVILFFSPQINKSHKFLLQ